MMFMHSSTRCEPSSNHHGVLFFAHAQLAVEHVVPVHVNFRNLIDKSQDTILGSSAWPRATIMPYVVGLLALLVAQLFWAPRMYPVTPAKCYLAALQPLDSILDSGGGHQVTRSIS